MKSIILLFLAAFSAHMIWAQTHEDLSALEITPTISQNRIHIDSLKRVDSGKSWLASQLFHLYKGAISSQDKSDCLFEPTCSEYALLAIKKEGFMLGFLNALDRLTRCNRKASLYYDPAEDGIHVLDPPKDIHDEVL